MPSAATQVWCVYVSPRPIARYTTRTRKVHIDLCIVCTFTLLTAGKLRALVRRVLSWPDIVVVTSYEGLKTLKALLLPCNWDYGILDEGQRIRNPDAAVIASSLTRCCCQRGGVDSFVRSTHVVVF